MRGVECWKLEKELVNVEGRVGPQPQSFSMRQLVVYNETKQELLYLRGTPWESGEIDRERGENQVLEC